MSFIQVLFELLPINLPYIIQKYCKFKKKYMGLKNLCFGYLL